MAWSSYSQHCYCTICQLCKFCGIWKWKLITQSIIQKFKQTMQLTTTTKMKNW